MKTVIIPEGNKGDLDEVDDAVRSSVEFVTAGRIEDVLGTAFVSDNSKPKTPSRRGRKPKEIKEIQTTEAI
jgi:ATP-dependent Lon protease